MTIKTIRGKIGKGVLALSIIGGCNLCCVSSADEITTPPSILIKTFEVTGTHSTIRCLGTVKVEKHKLLEVLTTFDRGPCEATYSHEVNGEVSISIGKGSLEAHLSFGSNRGESHSFPVPKNKLGAVGAFGTVTVKKYEIRQLDNMTNRLVRQFTTESATISNPYFGLVTKKL